MPKETKTSSEKKTSKTDSKRPAEEKRTLPQHSTVVRSYQFTRSLTWEDIVEEEQTRERRVKEAEKARKRREAEEAEKQATKKKEQDDKALIVEETDKKKPKETEEHRPIQEPPVEAQAPEQVQQQAEEQAPVQVQQQTEEQTPVQVQQQTEEQAPVQQQTEEPKPVEEQKPAEAEKPVEEPKPVEETKPEEPAKRPYQLPPAFMRTARWSNDERLDQKPYLEIVVEAPKTAPGKTPDKAAGQTSVALDFTARAPQNALQRAHVHVGFHPAAGVKTDTKQELLKAADYPGEVRDDTDALAKASVRRRFPVQTAKLKAAIDVMDKYDTGMPYNALYNNSNTFAANLAKQAAIPGVESIFKESQWDIGKPRPAKTSLAQGPEKERRALAEKLSKEPRRPGESDEERAVRQQEELDRYEHSLSRQSAGGPVKGLAASDIAAKLLQMEDKNSVLITDSQKKAPANEREAAEQLERQLDVVNRLKDPPRDERFKALPRPETFTRRVTARAKAVYGGEWAARIFKTRGWKRPFGPQSVWRAVETMPVLLAEARNERQRYETEQLRVSGEELDESREDAGVALENKLRQISTLAEQTKQALSVAHAPASFVAFWDSLNQEKKPAVTPEKAAIEDKKTPQAVGQETEQQLGQEVQRDAEDEARKEAETPKEEQSKQRSEQPPAQSTQEPEVQQDAQSPEKPKQAKPEKKAEKKEEDDYGPLDVLIPDKSEAAARKASASEVGDIKTLFSMLTVTRVLIPSYEETVSSLRRAFEEEKEKKAFASHNLSGFLQESTIPKVLQMAGAPSIGAAYAELLGQLKGETKEKALASWAKLAVTAPEEKKTGEDAEDVETEQPGARQDTRTEDERKRIETHLALDEMTQLRPTLTKAAVRYAAAINNVSYEEIYQTLLGKAQDEYAVKTGSGLVSILYDTLRDKTSQLLKVARESSRSNPRLPMERAAVQTALIPCRYMLQQMLLLFIPENTPRRNEIAMQIAAAAVNKETEDILAQDRENGIRAEEYDKSINAMKTAKGQDEKKTGLDEKNEEWKKQLDLYRGKAKTVAEKIVAEATQGQPGKKEQLTRVRLTARLKFGQIEELMVQCNLGKDAVVLHGKTASDENMEEIKQIVEDAANFLKENKLLLEHDTQATRITFFALQNQSKLEKLQLNI